MWSMPKSVKVVEVGPRDGLQSFPRWIETDVKVRMVDRLSQAGFPVIEVTGFVHSRVIPNLRDAEEVMARIARRPGVTYRGLVPNARGAERAAAARVDEMLGLITVSETYLRKNQNMTLDEAVEQAGAAFRIAERAGIGFVMALGASFWCPYEGRIPEGKVMGLLARFRDLGMRRFYLAGSLGMEDPAHVNSLFRTALDRWSDVELGFHVHNLAGIGTANVLAALDAGATSVEGSICGIGGGMTLPTTIASVGNLPSEDIVHLLNEMGIATGVATEEALAAARDIADMLDFEPRSHLAHCGTRADIIAAGRDHPRHHPT
jgi:hydroxymethylglutaryl-CoA lyase